MVVPEFLNEFFTFTIALYSIIYSTKTQCMCVCVYTFQSNDLNKQINSRQM